MSKKILLADDSVTIRKIVELTFGDSDYRVESVGSGAEALALFESMRPDVVVADVSVADPEGYAFCRRVKSSTHPVPVLLLAGTFTPYDEDAAGHCAADAHLTKPFDSASLVRTVELLLSTPPARLEVEPPSDDLVVPDTEVVDESPEVESVSEFSAIEDSRDPDDEFDTVSVEIAPLETSEVRDEDEDEVEVEPSVSEEADEPPPVEISALAREVVQLLSDEVVREIAREVVPEVAERVVRERIRELEADES